MPTPDDPIELAPKAAAGSNTAPFSDLVAPSPINPAPPLLARVLAFGGVLFGGLLGGLIGYGIGDLSSGGSQTWAAIGALIAGIGCAVGVGIIVSLTLRAMGEWKSVQHPEANRS